MNQTNAYDAYIVKCKSPKDPDKLKRIVLSILKLLRLGLSTDEIANELNELGVQSIQDKLWSYNALQMQLLKMAKKDPDSSLAWALVALLDTGEVSNEDIILIKSKTRVIH
jgi:hypothetical protein